MNKDVKDERDKNVILVGSGATPPADMRVVIVRGLQEMNAALRERLEECEELLANYGVDGHGAFPGEVDRYFGKYGIEHKCEEVSDGVYY